MNSVSGTDFEEGSDLALAADDENFVPAPRRSPRFVVRVGFAMIALQLLVRWWAVLEGFFFEDDFPNLYDAANSNLSFDLLFRGVNGHLKPGGYLLIWVLQQVAPMNFGVVAVVLVTLQLCASVAVWMLIRELIGERIGALVPLAVYLFSPLTLGAYLWYAASIETVLLQLVMAGALLFHVRHLRAGRRIDAVVSMLFVALGLANWEKALLVVPALLMFTVLWGATGGVLRRLVRSILDHWILWAAHALMVAGYLWLYLSRVGLGLGGEGVGSMRVLAREGVGKGFVPAVFGGWLGTLPGGPGEAADSVAIWLIPMLALLTVVVMTTVLQAGAWRAWLFLASYLALDVFLLASSGRAQVLGGEVGRDVRFFADASVIMVVSLSMALFPPDDVLLRRPRHRAGQALERRWVVPVVLVLYAANCAATSLGIVHEWRDTSAELYVRTAQADLQRLGDVVIADRAPPDDVLAPWFLEDQRVSRVIGPLPERPRFDEPTDQMYVVTNAGHVVAGTFLGDASSLPGPDSECGWRVGGTTAEIVPLDGVVYPWIWTVRIAYFSGTSTPGTVTIGAVRTTVTFQSGLHDLYLPHVGGAEEVGIQVDDGSATVCVGAVAFGHVGEPAAQP